MSASADIFLSYSRDDQATARRFAQNLETEGFTVWWDATLRMGESFDQAIEKALNEAKAVVVLWSGNSVHSRWVRAEATMADHNGTLAPVMIEACRRPIIFELTHTADLSAWTGDIKDPAWRTFIADLRRMVSKEGPLRAALPADHRSTGHAAGMPWYGGRSGKVALVALPVLISVAVAYGLLRFPAKVAHSVVASAPAPAAASEPNSRDAVAVLPFVNLTGDPSKQYFSDGMAEELINALTHVPGLKVPSRASSFVYEGHNTDLRRIAADLGVSTILEGSVRSAGDQIKVTAELVDAKSGFHLYSQSYDRKFADIFKLQEELAESIVMALRGTLATAQPAPRVEATPTRDVDAYRFYLQSLAMLTRGIEGLRQALKLADQAIVRDPTFARALALRGLIRTNFVLFNASLPNALEDAERDARQAVALDPNLADAQLVLGIISSFRGNWVQAEMKFRSAIKADPSDPVAKSNYEFYVLRTAGKLTEAHALSVEAFSLAPAVGFFATGPAAEDWIRGFDAQAVKGAELGIALGAPPTLAPVPLVFAFAASRNGRYAEAAQHAIESLPAALRDGGGAQVLKLVYSALADPSKRSQAREALRSLVQKFGVRQMDASAATLFITLFAMIDGVDQAYELANQSLDVSARSGTVGTDWGPLWLPEMRAFRKDSRFQKLVTRLKLTQYWQQSGPPDECEMENSTLSCR